MADWLGPRVGNCRLLEDLGGQPSWYLPCGRPCWPYYRPPLRIAYLFLLFQSATATNDGRKFVYFVKICRVLCVLYCTILQLNSMYINRIQCLESMFLTNLYIENNKILKFCLKTLYFVIKVFIPHLCKFLISKLRL